MNNIFNLIEQTTNFPDTMNVVVEISKDSDPVKYEICEKTGILMVDRFLPVSMKYPCNYGFIPNTKGGDNDCLDVLILSRYPILPSATIKVRTIGVLLMSDEKGSDEKVLCVPDKSIDIYYSNYYDIQDVPNSDLKSIEHF